MTSGFPSGFPLLLDYPAHSLEGNRVRPGVAFLIVLVLMIGFCGGPRIGALEYSPSLNPQEPADLAVLEVLGYTLDQAWSSFGPPKQVFPFRGPIGWQDMVVFYYGVDHFYLFWWDNRVWQIRFDKRYTGTYLGVSMAMTQADVLLRLGPPAEQEGDTMIYNFPVTGFSRQMRLVFEQGLLVDLYVYRSDF